MVFSDSETKMRRKICFYRDLLCQNLQSYIERTESNFVVEWLTLMLRNREVMGSNLGPETGYSDCDFSWFSTVPPDE
jgi:hypothetical protein